MDSKPIWKSRTLWFNAAIAVLVFTDQNLGALREHLSEWGFAWVVAILAAGNSLLRLLTDRPVAFGNRPPEVKP